MAETKVFWAGYINNEIAWSADNYRCLCRPAIYKIKKQAKNIFEDVRPVRIVEVKRKRRK